MYGVKHSLASCKFKYRVEHSRASYIYVTDTTDVWLTNHCLHLKPMVSKCCMCWCVSVCVCGALVEFISYQWKEIKKNWYRDIS
jgi:hypothetical protein